MDSLTRRNLTDLLSRAKDGEGYACEILTKEISRHFSYMLRNLNTTDPAYNHDDLLTQFQLGIWQAIAKVDQRGDPLYYLAWRGQRAVCSMLNVIRRRRYGTTKWIEEYGEERSIGTIPEGWDLPDTSLESDPSYVLEVCEGRDEAQRHVVYVLAKVSLTNRQQDVINWMMTDPDILGEGANLRLANYLGVSEQAASKHRKKVTALLSGIEEESAKAFQCEACGSRFGSKGALTQHKNGQSGHKRCTAVRV